MNTSQPIQDQLNNTLQSLYHFYNDVILKLPGADIAVRYIQSSYQDDPIRSVFELGLFLFALRYFLASKYSYSRQNYVTLSDDEVDDLVEDWVPESLVEPVHEEEKWKLEKTPVVEGQVGSHITLIQGPSISNNNTTIRRENVLNLASTDFLDFSSNPIIKKEAVEIVRRYGVGSCGPAGFYGNEDVHTKVEEDITKFLGTESTILYSQYLCTPTSVIPAFLKRGDIVVADEQVNVAIQKGLQISRCKVRFFKHNDIQDLEKVLKELSVPLSRGPLTRRFIATEGLFENTGNSPDLKQIIKLKNIYKYRLLLDESLSIGVLGKTGRGLPEEQGIPRSDIEITMGSLTNSFSSAGGFCSGSKNMVHHQRIAGSAYTFSATLPGFLAHTGSAVLRLIDEATATSEKSKEVSNLYFDKLHFYSTKIYDTLSNGETCKVFNITSRKGSPIIHLIMKNEYRINKFNFPNFYGTSPISKISRHKSKNLPHSPELIPYHYEFNKESKFLQRFIDYTLEKFNILIVRAARIPHQEQIEFLPQLEIFINIGFTEKEIEYIGDSINESFGIVAKEIGL